MTGQAKALKEDILELKKGGDRARLKEVLNHLVRQLPRSLESLELFQLGLELIETIEDPVERFELLFDFVKGLPLLGSFLPVYLKAVESAIAAADAMSESHRRTTELLRMAKELPTTEEFEPLRVYAWRLALGLPDRPRFARPSLEAIARELPKSRDYSFYQSYTLLGIARQMPKKGPFRDLYADAIDLAMDAAGVIDEPYYKKYALLYIAEEIKEREELSHLFTRAIEESYEAALEIKDPFAREHALIDVIRNTPKIPEFFDFLVKVFRDALSFFTIRAWMEDVEITDVVDFILSAEELGLKESKKRRFAREKYAKLISKELKSHGHKLRDLRFIDLFKPYTHVWVQPRELRDAIKKTVEHLETLRKTYHGKEIHRPVFLMESSRDTGLPADGAEKAAPAAECIAIDLGATNTVVVRKKRGAGAEFLSLDPLSVEYENIHLIPTRISAASDLIGAAVRDEKPLSNIKQMLLDGRPGARRNMERFLRVLYSHIKKSAEARGWLGLFSKGRADVVYITVPIGFTGYRRALGSITKKVFKGLKVEFIEEPLAAAVGYQVADTKDRNVMIVDFGGCTLDCMVLRLNVKQVHVIAKPERAQILGGQDIDNWLASHLAEKAGLDGENPPAELVQMAEELKIELSHRPEAAVQWQGKILTLNRAEFEELLDRHEFYRFIDRTIYYVLKRAEKVGLKRDMIEAVILTGGSSQIPSFRDKIGHIFPELRIKNLIFDHSPLSAVASGASLYGTKDVVDRHLAVAYAVRHVTDSKETPFSYTIVLEKGERLPFEKTFRIAPALRLGRQTEALLEFYEVPEGLVTRRWVSEAGVEFLKQELAEVKEPELERVGTVSVPLEGEGEEITLVVDDWGYLYVKKTSQEKPADTGIRLQ